MWLVEVVSVTRQLSVLEKFGFKCMILVIKAKLSFSELQIHKMMVTMVTRVLF